MHLTEIEAHNEAKSNAKMLDNKVKELTLQVATLQTTLGKTNAQLIRLNESSKTLYGHRKIKFNYTDLKLHYNRKTMNWYS